MNLINALATIEREFVAASRSPSVAGDPRQVRVMLAIELCTSEGQTVSTKHIAEALGLSKPAVTRAVDRLSEIGFVVRAKHPDDGRQVSLRLTKRGKTTLKRIEGAFVH